MNGGSVSLDAPRSKISHSHFSHAVNGAAILVSTVPFTLDGVTVEYSAAALSVEADKSTELLHISNCAFLNNGDMPSAQDAAVHFEFRDRDEGNGFVITDTRIEGNAKGGLLAHNPEGHIVLERLKVRTFFACSNPFGPGVTQCTEL